MTYLPLAIAVECPDAFDRVLELECADRTFLCLAREYGALLAEIEDIETGIEEACPAYFAQLRRRRVLLRQELIARLNA